MLEFKDKLKRAFSTTIDYSSIFIIFGLVIYINLWILSLIGYLLW